MYYLPSLYPPTASFGIRVTHICGGDYYYALKHGEGWDGFSYILVRFFRQIRTRYHLFHLWMIPVKWLGEMRVLRLAISQHKSVLDEGLINRKLHE